MNLATLTESNTCHLSHADMENIVGGDDALPPSPLNLNNQNQNQFQQQLRNAIQEGFQSLQGQPGVLGPP